MHFPPDNLVVVMAFSPLIKDKALFFAKAKWKVCTLGKEKWQYDVGEVPIRYNEEVEALVSAAWRWRRFKEDIWRMKVLKT